MTYAPKFSICISESENSCYYVALMSDSKPPEKQHSTSARGKKKQRSKPLQNKKRKLRKFKGKAIPRGKKPRR